MIAYPLASADSRNLVSELRFPDFEVSWAGGYPAPGIFCFGDENGKVWTTDEIGGLVLSFPKPFGTGEAINGVAFVGNRWMCVSSRDHLSLCEIMQKSYNSCDVTVGAHGVVAAENGYFYSPLGLNGFLSWQPQDGDEQAVYIIASDNPAYLYRLASIRNANGQNFIVSAIRHGGVGRMEPRSDGQINVLKVSSFGSLDVVDICAVKYGDMEGAVAIGRDGTIILYREVFQTPDPIVVKFPVIQGDVYRVLSVRGLLCVLTSKAIYILAELFDNAPQTNRRDLSVRVLTLEMEAIDVNVAGDRWILVVLNDKVLRIDVEMIQLIPETPARETPVETIPQRFQPKWIHPEPRWLQPEWDHREVFQEEKRVAMA
jgi:hypothetical protein